MSKGLRCFMSKGPHNFDTERVSKLCGPFDMCLTMMKQLADYSSEDRGSLITPLDNNAPTFRFPAQNWRQKHATISLLTDLQGSGLPVGEGYPSPLLYLEQNERIIRLR